MAKIYEFEGLMCSQCEHIFMVHFSGNIFQIYSKNETFDADDFLDPENKLDYICQPCRQWMDQEEEK